MIAGLKDIMEGKPINFIEDPNFALNYNVKDLNIKPTLPIKICLYNQEHWLQDYHYQTLELLKDKIQLIKIEDLDKYKKKGYQIIHNYGSSTYASAAFLRNLFINNKNYQFDINKKIYISRNKSSQCKDSPSYNINRRLILNEDNLYKELKKKGFERIYLEDYSVEEKIKIFNTSSIIISPFGGALTFICFC